MRVKRPFRKTKLRKSQTFLCSEYSEEFILFILRSPTKNKGFFIFLQIRVLISKKLCASPVGSQ